jgi:hypothetical protein
MFPYDRKRLRCHPSWTQLRSPIAIDIHITSHKKLSWLCSECDNIFIAEPKDVIVSTCCCKRHSACFKRDRMRYSGSIPNHITNVIRTGLLQCVDKHALQKLVVFLIDKENTELIAESCIEEVARFSKKKLLDNGFWWEDGNKRKNGSRYQQLPHAKRQQKMSSNASSYKKKEQLIDCVETHASGTLVQCLIYCYQHSIAFHRGGNTIGGFTKHRRPQVGRCVAGHQ